MSRSIDCILCAGVAMFLLGLVGAMDMPDQQRLAEHEAQRAKAVAVEIDRSVAWESLYTEGQRMTGYAAKVATK